VRRSWGRRLAEGVGPVDRPPRPPSGGKLRIGYVSAFFDKANWMKPVYGVINRHDRDRFEVHLVSLGGDPSALAGYREHGQDVIWQVGACDDEKVARLLAAAGIDVLIDLNAYYSSYTDFIGGGDYVLKTPTTHHGAPVPAGTIYSVYQNLPEDVTSLGVGVGLTYNLPSNFALTGSYNYATFDDNSNENSTFGAGFNTPENKFSVGLSNRKVTDNFGFNINFRWQEDFLWQSDFGDWNVPAFGVLDAQVSYKIPSIKTILKLGGTNLAGKDYRTNFGGPFVGQQYYLSLTFDQFLN